MKRVLITGMSGVGKSSVIAALAARGHKAVDLDTSGYCDLVPVREPDGTTWADWVWSAERLTRLLDAEDAEILFVAGTSTNQPSFYPRFDRILLLTAPDAVMVERMRTRTSNPYGSEPSEVARQLALKPRVEGWIRPVADAVIDTTVPLDDVVERVLLVVASPADRRV